MRGWREVGPSEEQAPTEGDGAATPKQQGRNANPPNPPNERRKLIDPKHYLTSSTHIQRTGNTQQTTDNR